MNQVAIFFVPAGATQRDFETALREHFASAEPGDAAAPVNAARLTVIDNDQWPLWTWFLTDPAPRDSKPEQP